MGGEYEERKGKGKEREREMKVYDSREWVGRGRDGKGIGKRGKEGKRERDCGTREWVRRGTKREKLGGRGRRRPIAAKKYVRKK